mgnify:CR=1 FL=1
MPASRPRVVYHHQLQKKRKPKKPPSVGGRPELSVTEILAWADAFHQRTGRWPKRDSGRIPETLDDKWTAVNSALITGLRGLPGGSSLARLLAKHRGVRNHMARPRLSPEIILKWADAHHRHTGKWPKQSSGSITNAPGETWLYCTRPRMRHLMQT